MAVGLVALATNHTVSGWLPRMLEMGGLSPSLAGFRASANLMFALPVVIFAPSLVRPHVRGRALAACALAAAVAMIGISATRGTVQFAATILWGASLAPVMTIIMLVLMDTPEIPTQCLASANGVVFSMALLGGFIGPPTMGALLDLTGGFTGGMMVLMALNLAAIPLALLLRLRRTTALPAKT